jgi:hypothetical protein
MYHLAQLRRPVQFWEQAQTIFFVRAVLSSVHGECYEQIVGGGGGDADTTQRET